MVQINKVRNNEVKTVVKQFKGNEYYFELARTLKYQSLDYRGSTLTENEKPKKRRKSSFLVEK